MASISLPRVLQQRKTSLEIERENFEKFQNQSINKAINGVEIPVKEKHVRSTIIGTFKEKGAVTFWVCATRLPLQGNRIVCWKFCHVLHKILREGHHNCLQQSQRHEQMLVDLGKLWVHLKEGYGKLIQLYCTLLISKINFHKRNPRFPGNLQVSGEELDSIGENDINNYFQMSVEIMDYMDDVLSLQSAIFDSLDNSRSNSMTSPGQCRLAPLIPCIQDSNQLYDFTVKLLFKLHAMLPADTLSGHRERFLKQFKQLKKFYQSTQNLQYFMNLISTPSLPENPPNFLIQSELRTYVPPIVILPPEENFQEDQDAIGNLIDTSENASQFAGSEASVDFVDYAGSQTSQHADIILERDKLIEHLQSEISRLRNELQSVIAENRATVASLNEQVTSLESQLAGVTADLQYEKEQRNLLVQQQMAQPSGAEVEQRVAAAEERAASFEDKFQKLKSVYKLLREEHIPLIREKAEAHRQMLALTKTTTEQEAKVETLQKTVDLLNAEKSKITETHVQSSSEAKAEAEKVKNEINILTEKYEAEKAELNATLAELRSSVLTFQSERDECQNQIKDLLQQKQTAESSLQDLDLKYKEAEKTLLKEIESTASARCSFMKCSIESASDIIKNTIHELDNPAISSLQCGLEYFRSLIPVTDDALNNMEKALLAYENDKSCMEDLSTAMVKTSHLMSTVVIEGVANSNTSKDIVFGEKMAQECRDLANAMSSCVSYIHSIAPTAEHLHKENGVSNGGDRQKAGDHMAQVKRLMQTLGELAGLVGGQDDSNSGDSVEGELANMDKAIEEAAARMEEMLKKSRAADSGLKLEVNEKILDACTSLMAAVRELVKKSRVLQGEIVVLGRGTNTAKEFYKRNHQWTEGLISAAKAVALGAKLLLTAADKVVTSGGKLEHVMVASQEIAASTAQLVVASRVRAARGSEKLSALTVASKAVSTATGAVIATAKTCAQMVEETEDLDMSGMSWQAGRRIEMESRVKVLELEQALATERLKLAAVRRNTYRLTDSELNEADANSKNGNNQ